MEQRYRQIEREMLAISWALQHFHIYIFGTHFDLYTDHKPLVSILNNPKSSPSARIERLCLKIQQYSYTIKHQKGADNPADYLSRHPMRRQPDDQFETKIEGYCNFLLRHSLPQAISVEQVRESTKNDTVLQHVMDSLKFNKRIMYSQFESVRHEFSVVREIVLRKNQIVLPADLQQRAITIAHKGHLGIVKTKQLLRTKIWFPSMDKIVEQLVKTCPVCQVITNEHNRDPISVMEPAKFPFEKVAVDFAGPFPNGKYIFIMVDECSRYPIVKVVSSTSFKCVEPILISIFAQFGIPESITSDNGPPFNGSDFANMSKVFNFKHRRTTPYWPEGNGRAERTVQTIKKSLMCAQLEDGNFISQLNIFLFNYRATPHSSTGKSPFEIMFGRTIKTQLPDLPTGGNQHCLTPLQERDHQSRMKNKVYADLRRRTTPNSFAIGDTVLCKQVRINKLTPPFDPRPYVVEKISGTKIFARREGKVIVRNSSFFKRFIPPQTVNFPNPFFLLTILKQRTVHNNIALAHRHQWMVSCMDNMNLL